MFLKKTNYKIIDYESCYLVYEEPGRNENPNFDRMDTQYVKEFSSVYKYLNLSLYETAKGQNVKKFFPIVFSYRKLNPGEKVFLKYRRINIHSRIIVLD